VVSRAVALQEARHQSIPSCRILRCVEAFSALKEPEARSAAPSVADARFRLVGGVAVPTVRGLCQLGLLIIKSGRPRWPTMPRCHDGRQATVDGKYLSCDVLARVACEQHRRALQIVLVAETA
jgi:hypothetical protein